MGGGVSKRRAAYVKRQVGERVAAAGESAAESVSTASACVRREVLCVVLQGGISSVPSDVI